jgi:hypothetical protein
MKLRKLLKRSIGVAIPMVILSLTGFNLDGTYSVLQVLFIAGAIIFSVACTALIAWAFGAWEKD